MKELKIKFDFSHGPIWKNRYDASSGQWSTGIDIIDNDATLIELNEEAQREYSSLYSFDKDGALNFDNQAFNEKKGELLSLIQAIIQRVESLNDGSILIVDEETSNLS